MVPPTVNGICLPRPVSTVECSAALNHQFDTPCVLRPCHMHLCADAVLLAGFTSHHDGQFLTYLEGHWQTPSSLSHRLFSAYHPHGNPSYSNLGVHSNSAEHHQHHVFYLKAKSVLCSLGSNQLTVFVDLGKKYTNLCVNVTVFLQRLSKITGEDLVIFSRVRVCTAG